MNLESLLRNCYEKNKDGTFTVTLPDFGDCTGSGQTLEEAYDMANAERHLIAGKYEIRGTGEDTKDW